MSLILDLSRKQSVNLNLHKVHINVKFIHTVHEFSRIVFHQQSFLTFRITGCFSGVSVVPVELKMYNYYNLAMYCFLLFSSYQKGVFTKHKLYIDL